MNKFIYLFAILGLLALSTAQIVEPGVSNAATDNAEEAGILTPFEDDLPVDGDSDYFKNGEDYGGIYEGYFEGAEGFVSTADDINDDFGSVEDPIVAEEFAGLVDVPEPFNEEDATIGEAVVEPSEDPFQFNQIPNDALDSDVGEDFYESWEGIVDSPDDIISEEGFAGLPDALIDFEEEATVDEPEALVDLEEAVVGEPEALIDIEEGKTESSDDESGEVGYPDDLIESAEDDFSEALVDYPDDLIESDEDDFSEGLVDYPDDLVESDEDFSEAFVDYPDNLAEAGEDVSEALVDYPDDYLIEEAFVDSPDDLFDSEGVTVDFSEAYVGKPEDITDAGEVDEPEDPKEDESEDITDAGEVDEPEDPKEDESEDITDAGEVDEPEDPKEDEPEDITDAGEVDEPEDPKEDEPEDITDAGEVDKPEDPKEDGEVELDPRVLDTNEEESTTGNGQGYAVQLDDVEQAEEKSKNFLG